MEPNYETSQRLIANKIIYRFDDVTRGDVTLLRLPSNCNVVYIKHSLHYTVKPLKSNTDSYTSVGDLFRTLHMA